LIEDGREREEKGKGDQMTVRRIRTQRTKDMAETLKDDASEESLGELFEEGDLLEGERGEAENVLSVVTLEMGETGAGSITPFGRKEREIASRQSRDQKSGRGKGNRERGDKRRKVGGAYAPERLVWLQMLPDLSTANSSSEITLRLVNVAGQKQRNTSVVPLTVKLNAGHRAANNQGDETAFTT